MNVVLLVAAGVVGGMLGGMGLGGGTLLIPILTFFLGLPTKLAAWLNLVCFLPAATVSLILHAKNRMVAWREMMFLLSFAVVGAAMAFVLGRSISEQTLKRAFGWMLIIFGSISFFSVLFGYFRRKT